MSFWKGVGQGQVVISPPVRGEGVGSSGVQLPTLPFGHPSWEGMACFWRKSLG